MICPSCGNDNPRTTPECISCGNKLTVIRCKCGFFNSLMDSYCGSCGKQLMKSNTISRVQRYESTANATSMFTEQELMRIIEVHQMQNQIDQNGNVVSQIDIDKLFE
jgi:hypothetical protein